MSSTLADIFLAAASSADRKRQLDMAQAQQQRENKLADEDRQKQSDQERAAQYGAQTLQEALGLASRGSPGLLQQVNPELGMKLEHNQAEVANLQSQAGERAAGVQAKEQAAAEARAQRTAAVKLNAAKAIAANPGSASQIQATIKGLAAHGHIDDFTLPGHTLPEGMAGPQAQATAPEVARLYGEGVAGGAPQTGLDEKLTAEGLTPGSAQATRRARELNTKSGGGINISLGGQQKLTEGATRQLQTDIDSGQELLSKLDYIDSLGDPAQFLTGGAQVKDTAVGLASKYPVIGKVAPGLATADVQAQHAKKTQFDQSTKDVMLSARRVITGTGGGEKEMSEIESSLLSGKLDPVAYRSAMQRVRQMTETSMAIKSDMLAKGINVGDPRYYPMLRQRWAEANRPRQPSPQAQIPAQTPGRVAGRAAAQSVTAGADILNAPPEHLQRLQQEAMNGDPDAQRLLEAMGAAGQ